jgi:hypothetical protein
MVLNFLQIIVKLNQFTVHLTSEQEQEEFQPKSLAKKNYYLKTIIKTSVAEMHHIYEALAPGENFVRLWRLLLLPYYVARQNL